MTVTPPRLYCNGQPSSNLSLPNYLGLGLFETLRARPAPGGKRIIAFSEHMARLTRSCEALRLSPPSENEVTVVLRDALSGLTGDGVVRILVEPGRWIVKVDEWHPTLAKEGIRVSLFEGARSLPQFKSFSSLLSLVARRDAESRDAQEALLVSNGLVTEGAWSNLFIVTREGTIVTPHRGMLPGITRQMVMRLLPVVECDVTVEMLLNASELFITQATHGVVPVIEVEGRAIGEVGRVTREVQEAYESLVGEFFEATEESSFP